MNISECSTRLRELTKVHSQNSTPLADYLAKRKLLLDALDLNINGVAQAESPVDLSNTVQMTVPEQLNNLQSSEPVDKTQPYFAKKLGTCMNFIKGTNNR
jgi:hypothetical protein